MKRKVALILTTCLLITSTNLTALAEEKVAEVEVEEQILPEDAVDVVRDSDIIVPEETMVPDAEENPTDEIVPPMTDTDETDETGIKEEEDNLLEERKRNRISMRKGNPKTGGMRKSKSGATRN